MEEQLVSFETAVLAKEKGFNDIVGIIRGKHYYNFKGELNGDSLEELKHRKENPNPYKSIPAPTQSLLQKWLRDKHDCIVIVDWGPLSEKYSYEIYYKTRDMDGEYVNKLYEDALEKGLQYALNLIK